MTRKIEMTVDTCAVCPFCHFESEIGEHFCVHGEEGFPVQDGIGGINIFESVHSRCPLPKVVPKVDYATTGSGGCCGGEDGPFNDFRCAVMEAVEEIPEAWLKETPFSREEANHLFQGTNTEFLQSIQDAKPIDFDEFDDLWQMDK
jgi:hypothetical protein